MKNEDLRNVDLFERGQYYHIYNRAIGDELLFRRTENYHYFMRKLREHMDEYWDIHCWCLMPNHFHLLVKIKDQIKGCDTDQEADKLIYTQFGHFTNGYAKAINKAYKRMGSLFIRKFKRKRVGDEAYLKEVIRYIHFNPVLHKFRSSVYDWKFCSFKGIVKEPEKFPAKEVIAVFGDLEGFLYTHRQ